MTLLDLSQNEIPDVWFAQTSLTEKNGDGVPSAYPLPNQFVPLWNRWIEVDEKLKVSFDDGARLTNPCGSIFALTQISARVKNKAKVINYLAQSAEVYVVEDENGIRGENVPDDIYYAWQQYKMAKAPKKKAVSKATGDIQKASQLDKLLKNFPAPTIEKNGFYVEKEKWTQILQAVNRKRNLLMYGVSGVGKSELCSLVGPVFEKSVSFFDMQTMKDGVSGLLGVHRLNGKSYFDIAPFAKEIQKPGIIVLQEINRAPVDANNILLSVLDSRRELRIDYADREQDRVIRLHDDCQFLSNANFGVGFAGTYDLDSAIKDRFGLLEIDYLPQEEEIKLLQLKTEIEPILAGKIVSIATEIRTLYKQGELTETVSPRLTQDIAEKYVDGIDLVSALEYTIIPRYLDASERDVVLQVMQAA